MVQSTSGDVIAAPTIIGGACSWRIVIWEAIEGNGNAALGRASTREIG